MSEIVTDAAVEAAIDGWDTACEVLDKTGDATGEAVMRAALTAALPHLADTDTAHTIERLEGEVARLREALAAIPCEHQQEGYLRLLTECRPCADTHPDSGCADVGCRHNCQAWIARAARDSEPTP